MSRTNDIVFVFSGGEPFSKTFPVSAEFNSQLWRDSEKKLQHRRKLLEESRGVDNNLKSNLDSVMKTIADFTPLNEIGQVCLLGRSAGCLLALALAAELNSKGVAELVFLGLSDVPMSHNGNVPPVPNVGAIKPINGPIATGATAPIGGRLRGVQPVTEIPRAKLDKEVKVKAGNKIQLFQVQGNHTKYASSRNEWIWHSGRSMEGEVHGILEGDGWDNQKKVVKGSLIVITDDDLTFHVNLNTGEHWKALTKKAAQEFANLPATPAP